MGLARLKSAEDATAGDGIRKFTVANKCSLGGDFDFGGGEDEGERG